VPSAGGSTGCSPISVQTDSATSRPAGGRPRSTSRRMVNDPAAPPQRLHAVEPDHQQLRLPGKRKSRDQELWLSATAAPPPPLPPPPHSDVFFGRSSGPTSAASRSTGCASTREPARFHSLLGFGGRLPNADRARSTPIPAAAVNPADDGSRSRRAVTRRGRVGRRLPNPDAYG